MTKISKIAQNAKYFILFVRFIKKLRIIAFHETCNIKHETNIRYEEKGLRCGSPWMAHQAC